MQSESSGLGLPALDRRSYQQIYWSGVCSRVERRGRDASRCGEAEILQQQ